MTLIVDGSIYKCSFFHQNYHRNTKEVLSPFKGRLIKFYFPFRLRLAKDNNTHARLPVL